MSKKPNSIIKMPSLEGLRLSFMKERQAACENQFESFIRILEEREYHSVVKAREAIEEVYKDWAEKFELLKREFNAIRDLFQDVERRVTGWYCVSPNLAQWGAIGWGAKTGYTFASAVMKNHHRKAPRSEKSLSVSFALDEKPEGIGDEGLVGRRGAIDDALVGLSRCSPKSLQEQGDGVKALHDRIKDKNIVFRLNHRTVGQQVAKLPLSVLDEYSLRELCQGLFLALNNDVITELRLNSALENPQKLIAAGEN